MLYNDQALADIIVMAVSRRNRLRRNYILALVKVKVDKLNTQELEREQTSKES